VSTQVGLARLAHGIVRPPSHPAHSGFRCALFACKPHACKAHGCAKAMLGAVAACNACDQVLGECDRRPVVGHRVARRGRRPCYGVRVRHSACGELHQCRSIRPTIQRWRRCSMLVCVSFGHCDPLPGATLLRLAPGPIWVLKSACHSQTTGLVCRRLLHSLGRRYIRTANSDEQA
jgi:hypothetical protein